MKTYQSSKSRYVKIVTGFTILFVTALLLIIMTQVKEISNLLLEIVFVLIFALIYLWSVRNISMDATNIYVNRHIKTLKLPISDIRKVSILESVVLPMNILANRGVWGFMGESMEGHIVSVNNRRKMVSILMNDNTTYLISVDDRDTFVSDFERLAKG